MTSHELARRLLRMEDRRIVVEKDRDEPVYEDPETGLEHLVIMGDMAFPPDTDGWNCRECLSRSHVMRSVFGAVARTHPRSRCCVW